MPLKDARRSTGHVQKPGSMVQIYKKKKGGQTVCKVTFLHQVCAIIVAVTSVSVCVCVYLQL